MRKNIQKKHRRTKKRHPLGAEISPKVSLWMSEDRTHLAALYSTQPLMALVIMKVCPCGKLTSWPWLCYVYSMHPHEETLINFHLMIGKNLISIAENICGKSKDNPRQSCIQKNRDIFRWPFVWPIPGASWTRLRCPWTPTTARRGGVFGAPSSDLDPEIPFDGWGEHRLLNRVAFKALRQNVENIQKWCEM